MFQPCQHSRASMFQGTSGGRYLSPTPLAAMPYPPAGFDWPQAAALGFRNIVCLSGADLDYDSSPLRTEAAVALQDLVNGNAPDDPDSELTKVLVVVDAVITSLTRPEGVLVHCGGGTGRSEMVVEAARFALGEDPGDVATWLDRVHRARGRRGWPESLWQRSVLELFTAGP
jgi:hypothetical protein